MIKKITGESKSYLYSFIIVLEDVLNQLKIKETNTEKLKIIGKRLGNTLNSFISKKVKDFVVALVTDICKKIGLENTIKVFKDLNDYYNESKT